MYAQHFTNVRRRLPVALLPAALLLGACRTPSREQELERVAKDWCQAIRASQVMPVYPLTQDVHPGDVFLVRTPIDQQQAEWRTRGYLPLDNHLARLDPTGYAAFYQRSFPQPGTVQDLPLAHLQGVPPWSGAPHAGFPTYAFSVQKGGALNLAVPVSGVPVGLGLLGATSAEGTISIGKAHTLGVDLMSLDGQLRAWADQDRTRAFLAGLASTPQRRNYVRVVTRVYLTGELEVSLRDTSTRSAGLDVGAGSPVEALVPRVAATTAATPEAAAANYAAALAALNEMLASNDRVVRDAAGRPAVAPGGSLRLTAATARTIAMKETFEPPLVLGYLGFDCEIGPGGRLGPAVPTLAVVSGALGGEAFLAQAPIAAAYLDSMWASAYEIARTRAAADPAAQRVVAECDALAATVPPSWLEWAWEPSAQLRESTYVVRRDEAGTYPLYRKYVASLASSEEALRTAFEQGTFKLQRGASLTVVTPESDEAAALRARQQNLAHQAGSGDAAHGAARRALADWLFFNLYDGAPR